MATKLETLIAIGNAMQVEPFYLFVSESSVKTYVKQGLVETRPEIQNEDFHIAARLTEAGITFVKENINMTPTVETPATATAATAGFEIIADVPMPKSKRGGNLNGGRKCKYPFDALQVGQMFFVPATEACPNPAKSMVGGVSAANKRYAVAASDGATKINRNNVEVPVLIYTRKFVIRPFTKDGVEGAGVWRDK